MSDFIPKTRERVHYSPAIALLISLIIRFVPLDVTEGDLVLGSIAFGWFVNFFQFFPMLDLAELTL